MAKTIQDLYEDVLNRAKKANEEKKNPHFNGGEYWNAGIAAAFNTVACLLVTDYGAKEKDE
jgi:hypothetical protein